MTKIESLKEAFNAIRTSADRSEIRGLLATAARELPKTIDSLETFKLGFELLDLIEDPRGKRLTTLDYTREIPSTGPFAPLYRSAMEVAITAADAVEEDQRRITELIRIANELPKTEEFTPQRVRAWRLALSLPDSPRNVSPSLKKLAKRLPKANDYAFYRGYTLLGVAKKIPLEGALLDVYREAIELAMRAAAVIEEPYYKKYALEYIAGELKDEKGMEELYSKAMNGAYDAALELKDPFAMQRALLDLINFIPRTHEMLPLLNRCLAEALKFFTIKKWMGDVEALDVVDYILSAEELGIRESKQKKFLRETYADSVSRALNKLKEDLNDTRFIVTLKPYTHVWIRPKRLRDTVKGVVEHLESLKDTFHGAEIERPEFVSERHTAGKGRIVHKKETTANECISIDLGATNTVIMKKKADGQPEFVRLPGISKDYSDSNSVPTVLSSGTNVIGAQVTDEYPVVNIKQLMLDGNPKGKAYMERYLRILAQNLKKNTATSGWFSLGSRSLADILYLTVPVGHVDYRNALKAIVDKTFKGMRTEFIEEALAAAVGYQVAEQRDKLVLVIDFGGSTLDTMILRLNLDEVHVVAKPDRAKVLGGYDIDVWLSEYLSKKTGISTPGDSQMLISSAEELKIGLSDKAEVPFVWDGTKRCGVTREEFEEILEEHDFYKLIDRTISNLLRKAEKVGVNKENIEAILLTGGSSQIPSFKDKIGHIFADLREANRIFDHSPLTAVGTGASLYGTRDISDRHLGLSYALRFTTNDKEAPYSYRIVLEKGETLPFEKTFRVRPATKLGPQNEIYIELFEVPDRLIKRIWVMEGGIEFIKQELERTEGVELKPLKTVTLHYGEPLDKAVDITFSVDESWNLNVRGEGGPSVDTGIGLQ